jgi:hypothetical protein
MNEQTSTFRISRRYQCTMTAHDDGEVAVKWEPHLPHGLKKKEMQAYRRGRDAFIAQLFSGKRCAVVEV